MFRGLGVPRPFVGDADPANEADFTIDDEQLAVGAVIVAAEIRIKDGVVAFDLHPGVAHHPVVGAGLAALRRHR